MQLGVAAVSTQGYIRLSKFCFSCMYNFVIILWSDVIWLDDLRRQSKCFHQTALQAPACVALF
ncbi:hypothetical protein BCR43DRAFT_482133 [Syncephalastrum racemosum]|uniref:Uncharacterized protein n=1 Tax=Syncephalastrum racemosum TaxID=13706 RepID=A0A1X2HT92_SYNRA|nr:hypothetical protein BCR43DRAFT_482133 [Syncephalastrum racemosum]